jgi:hypothetical protein
MEWGNFIPDITEQVQVEAAITAQLHKLGINRGTIKASATGYVF